MIQNGQPGGGYLLKYGGIEIPFRISHAERSNLTINVFPDLRVEVLAPLNKSLDMILAKVDRRAQWIVKQCRYFEQYQPTQPERRFVSGETHVYLGRQYRLKVQKGYPEGVKLIGQFLYVRLENRNDSEKISDLLEKWYRAHAQHIFANRLKVCLKAASVLKLAEIPNIVVRKMKKRWGSCTKKGLIFLNMELVKAPVHCIDYVIIHELCHLKVPNHGKNFYRFLNQTMRDWERRKKQLESVML